MFSCGIYNTCVIAFIKYFLLGHVTAIIEPDAVNMTQLERQVDEVFNTMENMAGPNACLGRGSAKLAIKIVQLEERLRIAEELLQKVARPYLSLPKNSATSDAFYVKSFNFFDQMALSMCTSLVSGSGHVYQVRRDCDKIGIPSAQTCNDICKGISDSARCFDTLHLYRSNEDRELNPSIGPYSNDNKQNLWSYHYGPSGCGFKASTCGPNYCCCRA